MQRAFEIGAAFEEHITAIERTVDILQPLMAEVASMADTPTEADSADVIVVGLDRTADRRVGMVYLKREARII